MNPGHDEDWVLSRGGDDGSASSGATTRMGDPRSLRLAPSPQGPAQRIPLSVRVCRTLRDELLGRGGNSSDSPDGNRECGEWWEQITRAMIQYARGLRTTPVVGRDRGRAAGPNREIFTASHFSASDAVEGGEANGMSLVTVSNRMGRRSNAPIKTWRLTFDSG